MIKKKKWTPKNHSPWQYSFKPVYHTKAGRKYQRNVSQTHVLLIYSGTLSHMLQTLPSPPLDTESSLILPHRNSDNLWESLWRERAAERGVTCYSVTDTDKILSTPPESTKLFWKTCVSQLNHVLREKITTVFTFCKKREKKNPIWLHELHFHLISVGLLWWRPQRTPVGQKEINLLLQRRSRWMPEGKLVLMQTISKQVRVQRTD